MYCNKVMNVSSDLVSVIVPVYNVEKYIYECVESIANQTYGNIEIILVDDGSTDNSPTICDQLAQEDNRIVVIHQKNKGLPGARNSGLRIAKGKWVLFIDSDDWIAENAIEILVAESNKDVDMVLFNLEKKNEYAPFRVEGSEIGRAVLSSQEIDSLFHDAFDPMKEEFTALHEGKVTAVTKLYNIDFLQQNYLSFFEEVKVHEDIPFAVVVYSKATRIVFVDVALYMYRYNPNSITNSFRPNYMNEMKNLVVRMGKISETCDDTAYAQKLLNNRILVSTINLLIRCFCHKNNPKSYNERKQDYYEWVDYIYLREVLRNTNSSEFQFKKRIATFLLKINYFGLLDIVMKFC